MLREDNPMLVNRYYAAKTLHMHKVTNAAPLSTNYNSLGLTHPYSDETDISNTLAPATYPVNVGYVPTLYIEKYKRCREKYYIGETNGDQNFQHASLLKEPIAVRCVMEDPYGYWLYVNGGSLSILSNISPVVYLSTLLVIYQLSLASFIIEVTFYGNFRNMYKRYVDYAILLVYAVLLLVTVTGMFTKTSSWGDPAQKVNYSLNSNISSLIYCFFVLVIFYMRKSMRYPYWRYMFFYDKSKDIKEKDGYMAQENEEDEVTAELVYATEFGSDDPNYQLSPDEKQLVDDLENETVTNPLMKIRPLERSKTLVHYAEVPVNNVYPQYSDVFNPPVRHSMNMGNLRMPGDANKFMNSQGLLMDQTARVTSKFELVTSSKTYGPASNETSVIVSLTVLLGGIANLAMARGVLPETEAQLVIFCVFSFFVLEWARNHLFSYFWYMAMYVFKNDSSKDNFEKNAQVRVIIAVIDLVAFLIQMIIVIAWQLTMTSLLNFDLDAFRAILLTIVGLFMLIRLFSVLSGLSDVWSYIWSENFKDFKQPILWQMESWTYLGCIWLIVWCVFAFNLPTGDTSETSLMHEEKLLYNSTSSVLKNNDCLTGIQKVTLMSTILKNTCTKAKQFPADPVDIKVFGWTRWWRLASSLVINDKQDNCLRRNCQSSSLLFCANGFEMHWGECKRSIMNVNYPRDEWTTTALKSQYAFMGGTELKMVAA